jgi:hypothetical protein
MSTHADLEVFMDMMGDDVETPFDITIEKNQENHYYTGLGINILKQIENNDHYFHFVTSILKNFNTLDCIQKDKIIKQLGVKPEVIVKEKIVYKEKKNNKYSKPRLNTYDDY